MAKPGYEKQTPWVPQCLMVSYRMVDIAHALDSPSNTSNLQVKNPNSIINSEVMNSFFPSIFQLSITLFSFSKLSMIGRPS